MLFVTPGGVIGCGTSYENVYSLLMTRERRLCMVLLIFNRLLGSNAAGAYPISVWQGDMVLTDTRSAERIDPGVLLDRCD